MPFKPKELAVLAFAGKFTLFVYAPDAGDDLNAPGYFDRAADKMKVCDVVLVTQPGQTTKFFTVMANQGKSVTVACGADVMRRPAEPLPVKEDARTYPDGSKLPEGFPDRPLPDAPPPAPRSLTAAQRRSTKKVKLQPRK